MTLRTRATAALQLAARRVPRLGAVLAAARGKPQRRSAILSGSPPKTAMHWSSVRGYTDITPAMIRAAETAADAGQLYQAARLCESMLGDDRIQGCLQEVRVRGLLGLDLTFEPGRGRGRGKAVQFLEAEEDWDVAYPDHALCEMMTWGILLGVGPAWNDWQQVERPTGGKRQIPVLQNWPAQHVRCDTTTNKWYAKQADGTEREITPGDGLWILHTPYGLIRPWARGSWRALSRWFLLKQYAKDDWGRYSERHGMGLFVGTASEGSSPTDRAALAADLANIARDSEFALPPGYKVELIESTANTWSTFKAQIDMANLAIAINLLGQNLSTEVQAGSFAAAKALGSVKNSILKADAWTASSTLHDQSIAFWAEYNFQRENARKLAPWPIWNTDLPEDLAAKATTLSTAGEALTAWENAGVPVDKEKYAEDFGVPVKEGEPFTPAKQPAPPALGAPSGNGEEAPPTTGKPEAETPEPTDEEPPDETAPVGTARLASGDSADSAKGFIRGQQYADALAANARDQGAAALSPWIDEVAGIIEKAESYESMRKALLKAYPNVSGDEFENLTARALVLAEMAGRLAVLEDA
ncbi:MAG: DUF935 family protein [bacterium]